MVGPKRPAFMHVSVGGAPKVQICLDLETEDPYTRWFLDHDWIDEPVQRVFLAFVEPGSRVLDLGCHIGTFSLAAAGLGAEVIAVDASPRHVELVRLAARRNGFAKLHAVVGALTDSAGNIDFIERSIHGRPWMPGDPVHPTVVVPAVTVDGLLEQHGWETVDAVKIDIEGSEMAALRGMGRLFASGARPPIVFECNGAMLPLLGSSITELRSTLAELGYALFFIDHLRPGVLAEATVDGVQPECVSDFIAAMSLPPALVDAWTLEPPFGLEQTLTRLLDQAADPAAGYRRYAAQVLASAPDRLREHPLAGPAVRALELDLDSSVRSVLSSEQPQPNGGIVPSPTPAAGPPPGVALVVEEAAIRRPSAELDHLSGPAPEDLCLRDISFHVRSGELLAIVCDDPAASRALLRAVAGFDPIADGILLRAGHGVLVSDLGSLIEPTLSVRENIILLASYLGGHAGESARQAELHAARAGVQDALDNPLLALAAAAVERLTITLALECVRAPLLLLDHLPPLQDAQFSRWVRDRAGQRRQEGISMLEAGSDGSWVLGPPDRILWLERGDVVACGHADSVLDAIWKRQLGLVTAS